MALGKILPVFTALAMSLPACESENPPPQKDDWELRDEEEARLQQHCGDLFKEIHEDARNVIDGFSSDVCQQARRNLNRLIHKAGEAAGTCVNLSSPLTPRVFTNPVSQAANDVIDRCGGDR